MSIRAELMEVTSIKPKKKEDDYAFIKRLVAAVEDLPDDEWGNLGTESQEYVNSVVEAKKKYDDWDELPADEVPLFPDEGDEAEASDEEGPSEDAEADEENDGDTTEDEDGEKKMKAPAKKKTGGKAPAAEKTEKAAKAGRAASKEKEKPAAAKAAKSNGSGKKPVSAIHRIRQIVVKKPKISTDDLIAQLEKEGFTTSKMTVGTTKQGTRDTMKALVAAGMLEVDL